MPQCPHCQEPVAADAQRCPQCRAWFADAKQSDDEVENSIRSLLNEGKKIEAIKLYRQHSGAGLAEAKDAVELIERGEPLPDSTPVTDDLEEQILELMAAGQKIAAIKLHRERTHVGLKEAKDAVEALASRHGITVPSKSGCLAVLLVLVFGALMGVGWISSLNQ